MKILEALHVRRVQGLKVAFVGLFMLGILADARLGDSPKPRVGSVRGKVVLDLEGVRLSTLGPLVVFLDALEGKLNYEIPKDIPSIRQRNAKFSPTFLVITAGQSVSMPNDDTIFHNVFSYSKPNDFDVGIYPKDTSREVTFEHAGVVHIYCSIHSSMNGRIFVAPSPYFDEARSTGAFSISGVPVGRYRLRTWNAKLPESTCVVEVKEGEKATVEIVIRPSESGSGSPSPEK